MIRLALAIVALSLAVASTREWKHIEAPFVPHFPRDHGAHPDYRTEWWYATGELVSESGAEHFGFQLTIFRQGLDPNAPRAGESTLRARQVLAGQLAIVDVTKGRVFAAERSRRIGAGLASAREDDMDVVLEDWEMRRDPSDQITLAAKDRAAEIALDLVLAPAKPIVLHGADGVSRKGAELGNASAYASWTRLSTRGTITVADRQLSVRGESWFDHEWGTSQLGPGVVGWDWFGLRLADGRDVMVYRLRSSAETAFASATLVAPDGTATGLAATEFTLTALASWKSPRTSALYPTRWRLAILSAAIDVEIVPRVPDCEIDARSSTGTIYWEGPVAVSGSVVGSGYGELTGYASSMAARF